MKLCKPGKEHLETHYADLKSKPFFAGLVNYMNSGPICAMVWEGLNVVKMGRMMLGGRGRIRQPRDRPLVQTGRAHRLRLLLRRMDLRIISAGSYRVHSP